MNLIAHRRNTLAELQATPTQYGVEIDLRTLGQKLIVQHDPYVAGEDFERWLDHFKHGTLILNVKEEGLEERLIGMMDDRGISDYFFLDQSFPFLIRCSRRGERRCAARVSEYECVETALTLAGLIDWVWVDCFSRFPLTAADVKRLHDAGFKLCLVSPELQGRVAEAEIPAMVELLRELAVVPDAVCTKRPDLWEVHSCQ